MSNHRESPRIKKSFYSDDLSCYSNTTKNRIPIRSSIFNKKNIENGLIYDEIDSPFQKKINESLIKTANKDNINLKLIESGIIIF
jgi:hypothetical protein